MAASHQCSSFFVPGLDKPNPLFFFREAGQNAIDAVTRVTINTPHTPFV
jgi:hypothetical protein